MMLCTVENCKKEQVYKTKRLCISHYKRMWEFGTLELTRIVGDDVKRFWSKVDKTDTCWLWTGSGNPGGYGLFLSNGKNQSAHRYSYKLHKGEIPAGLYLDHLCRVPACVNPDHLEPVTNRENGIRGLRVTAKKSGLPLGVTHKRDKFRATIMVDGKSIILGSTFKTPQEAHKAYLEAAPCH